jgi:hypothetical protein
MCFICLQMYVASVASGCFKSRSGVASLYSLFCYLTSTSVSHPLLPAPAGPVFILFSIYLIYA